MDQKRLNAVAIRAQASPGVSNVSVHLISKLVLTPFWTDIPSKLALALGHPSLAVQTKWQTKKIEISTYLLIVCSSAQHYLLKARSGTHLLMHIQLISGGEMSQCRTSRILSLARHLGGDQTYRNPEWGWLPQENSGFFWAQNNPDLHHKNMGEQDLQMFMPDHAGAILGNREVTPGQTSYHSLSRSYPTAGP